MLFENIIGQQKAKDIISGQLKSAKVPHAYLFLGQEGIGRKLAAMELAKALNCVTSNACGHCPACSKIDRGIHPDVQLVDFSWQASFENKDVEKQRSIKINTIREIQRQISFKPSEGKWKIFIIEPAEKITIDAANCLLKTLEEPPKWTLIILLARNRENLPATVVSRTQIIPFAPLKEADITEYLTKLHSIELPKARKIASRAEGSLSIALELLEEDLGTLESLWDDIKQNVLVDAELLAVSQQSSKNAAEFTQELLTLVKTDFKKEPERFRDSIAEILSSKKLLEKNINSQMVLDNLLLKLTRNFNTTPTHRGN